MVSHGYYPALQHSHIAEPASLSAEVIQHRLRQQNGFEGIVITDDLDMGALNPHGDAAPFLPEERLRIARQATLAGADVLLYRTATEEHLSLVEALVAEAMHDSVTNGLLHQAHVRSLQRLHHDAQHWKPVPTLLDKATLAEAYHALHQQAACFYTALSHAWQEAQHPLMQALQQALTNQTDESPNTTTLYLLEPPSDCLPHYVWDSPSHALHPSPQEAIKGQLPHQDSILNDSLFRQTLTRLLQESPLKTCEEPRFRLMPLPYEATCLQKLSPTVQSSDSLLLVVTWLPKVGAEVLNACRAWHQQNPRVQVLHLCLGWHEAETLTTTDTTREAKASTHKEAWHRIAWHNWRPKQQALLAHWLAEGLTKNSIELSG
jgi:hypothetical protein